MQSNPKPLLTNQCVNCIKNSKIGINFDKSYLGSLVLPLRGQPTVKVLGLVTKTKLHRKS